MGFTINARVIFDSAKAMLGIGKVSDQADKARQSVNSLGDSMAKAGGKLSRATYQPPPGMIGPIHRPELLKPPKLNNGPTKFQRDVKLANESVRSLVQVSSEARKVLKVLGISWAQGKQTRTIIQQWGHGLNQVKSAASNVRSSLGGVTALVAGAFAAIGAGEIFSKMSTFFTSSMKLAQNMEDARVTFDVMLGSSEKSTDLLNRAVEFANKTPFQKMDIIEASKTLLRVTRDNVDENEKLFKLSANIAALKPGRNVSDVALGMAQASVGEFEILKSFGLVLRADSFKKYGKPGTDKYIKAVNEEIQRQFQKMTGGRDLVGMLAETLTGKLSTAADTLEMAMTTVGQSMVKGFGVKKLVQKFIDMGDQFNMALELAFSGKARRGAFKGIPPGMVAIAKFIKLIVDRMIQAKDIGIAAVGKLWEWWNNLSTSVRSAYLQYAAIGMAISTLGGIVGPIVAALGTMAGAVLSVFGGQGVLISIFGLISSMIQMVPLIVAAATAFMLFRKPGETLHDTFGRAWEMMKQGYVVIKAVGEAFMAGFVRPIAAAVLPTWTKLQDAFGQAREVVASMFTEMGDGGITLGEVTSMGQTLGNVLVWLVTHGVDFVVMALKSWTKFMKTHSVGVKNTISDIRNMGKALFDLIAGVGDARTNLKTFMLGIADFMLSPWRFSLNAIFTMFHDTLMKVEGIIRPISSTLADKVASAARGAESAGAAISEGFLKTTEKAKGAIGEALDVNLNGQLVGNVKQPIELKLDGKTIAQTDAETEMRARNAGRGGDPMNPEELGFVLEGNKVRTVSLSEVAARN